MSSTEARGDVDQFIHRGQVTRFRRSGSPPAGVPPTVFVGGAFQDLDSWRRFEAAFSPRTEVVTVDLPGSGSSTHLDSAVGLEFLADALRALLEELGLPPVYVVSASYGSPVGYLFSQRFPERVDRVCLAGIMREIPEHRREATERSVRLARAGRKEELGDAVVEGLLCQDPARSIERRRLAERVLRSGILAMDPEALGRYASNTERLLRCPPLDLERPPRVPTLVFTGEHDVFTTPAYCREVADAIPGSRFALIPRADHLAHIERFDATIELLTSFAGAESREDARAA